jgi:hypothetical protein
MPNAALDILEDLSGIALEPVPIEFFGHDPELNGEVSGEVFGLDFPPFLFPQPQQRGFIVSQNNSSVRATDKGAPRSVVLRLSSLHLKPPKKLSIYKSFIYFESIFFLYICRNRVISPELEE